MKYFLLVLLIFTATFGFAQSYESSGMDSIRAFYHGFCRTVEVSGDYAYYSAGQYIHIADITDPANPEEISEISLGVDIIESVKDGNYIYYTLRDYGFCVLDVSDPALPEIISYELRGYSVESIHISDTIAFVCAGEYGMFIMNIADPHDVEEIAHYTYESCDINCVDTHGDYAYISDYGTGLKVVDISDLTAPVEVGEYVHLRTVWLVYDDGIVYMDSRRHNNVISVDVTDPTSPEDLCIREYRDLGLRPIMDIYENKLFLADSSVHVFDIDYPSYIYELSVYHINGNAMDIHIVGDLAFVADFYGMAILDISDVSSISCLSYSYTVLVLNNLFCYENNIYGWSIWYRGSQRIDVSEPFAPEEDTSYNFGCYGGTVIDSNIVYANGAIWDFSEPVLPEIISYLPLPHYYHMITTIDNYSMMYYDDKIYRCDLSDLTAPVIIDTVELDYEIEQCVMKDSLIFCTSENHLIIYEFDDFFDLTELSRVAISIPYDITLYKNNILLSFSNEYVRNGYGVVDFSDPTSPEYFFHPEINLHRLEMIGNIGIDFRKSDGLRLFDFSDLHAPIELANFYSHGAIDYVRNGTFLYMTSTLYVLDISSYFEETTYEISRGWNLISYPFEGENAMDSHTYPIIEPMYTYDNVSDENVSVSYLTAGTGFWVLGERDTSINIAPLVPVDALDIKLRRGWNLIGGLNEPLPMTYFTDLPYVPTSGFEFDPATGSYFESDTLRPQKGYWILSTDSVTVHLP